MGEKGAKPDLLISAIAAKQHGVISIRQLNAVGLGRNAVTIRVRAGRLHRLHQGVYAVGHSGLSDEARWMAAVLACGIAGRQGEAGRSETVLDYWGAALSYRSAAELWQLLPTKEGPIDVSIPGEGGRRKRSRIRLHRSLTLLPAAVTLRSGIAVTTPTRTIADLRRVMSRSEGSELVSPRELRRAIRQADALGLPLDDSRDRDPTRSDLERDFLWLCRHHRLPAPEVNVRAGPHLVDFLWRDRRLIVETDGYGYHSGRTAFQDDRARDLDLRARSFQVVRLSEKQVNEEAPRVAEVLRRALRVGADGSE